MQRRIRISGLQLREGVLRRKPTAVRGQQVVAEREQPLHQRDVGRGNRLIVCIRKGEGRQAGARDEDVVRGRCACAGATHVRTTRTHQGGGATRETGGARGERGAQNLRNSRDSSRDSRNSSGKRWG